MISSDTPTPTVPTHGHPRLRMVRRTLVTVGLTGALAVGGFAFPAVATASPAPSSASASQLLPGFCPFGSYPDGGCRGGSINDNERLNDSLADTGDMYVDAGECAAEALAKSVKKNRKRLSLPTIGLGTIKPALKCGHEKGY